jgi:hypothetical protein
MSSREKFFVAFIVLMGAVLFGSVYYFTSPHRTVQAQPAPCVAAANEQCPSSDWLKDYREWKALNDEIEGALKKKKDLRTGWASRLSDTMPPGYYFNVDTQKFQKRELAQPVPVPKAK